MTIVPANNAIETPTGNLAANPTPVSPIGDISQGGSPVDGNPVVSVTQVVTLPADSNNDGGNGGSASLSWVAAPVVGGIAAFLVVIVLVIMFRKRRNNSRGSSSGGSWKSVFGLGSGKSRAPPMQGGTGGILGSSRTSSMQRLGSSDGRSVPVYEVKGGKVALRETTTEVQRPMTGLFRSN